MIGKYLTSYTHALCWLPRQHTLMFVNSEVGQHDHRDCEADSSYDELWQWPFVIFQYAGRVNKLNIKLSMQLHAILFCIESSLASQSVTSCPVGCVQSPISQPNLASAAERPPREVHNAKSSHVLLLEHSGQHLLASIVTPTACNTPTDVWVLSRYVTNIHNCWYDLLDGSGDSLAILCAKLHTVNELSLLRLDLLLATCCLVLVVRFEPNLWAGNINGRGKLCCWRATLLGCL